MGAILGKVVIEGMAADKLCPQLQPSLSLSRCNMTGLEIYFPGTFVL